MGVFNLNRLKEQSAESSAKQHNILLVDDDPENLRAFISFLNKEYHVTTALDGTEALELIAKHAKDHFHLIISDQRMPRLSGVEFLERTLELVPRAKRIILSGYTDADATIASVNRARIHEFLLKPVERHKLLLTVKRALEAYDLEEHNNKLVKDLTRLNAELEAKVAERTQLLEDAMEKLEAMATTDQLTGAYNRRKFDEIIEREVEGVRRYEQVLSLIIFDLDHFKRVNDRFGHLCGDEVLKELVRLVKANIRPTDCLIRWGGEEFLILVPHTDLEGTITLAEKIRAHIENHFFPEVKTITISAGVTQYKLSEIPDMFVSRGDRALYQAKRSGRNRVVAEP